jgi:uncharacterized lipoprotein YajG
MKKVIAIVAIAAFTACNSGSNTPATTDSTKVDSTKTTVDTAKVAVDSTKK